MSVLDRFTAACLRSAAGRWPEDIADEMHREWRAELAAIEYSTPGGPLRRAWRRVTFAVSLACSPAADPAPSVAGTARDRLAGLGHALAYLAMTAGVLLIATTIGPLGRGVGELIAKPLGGGGDNGGGVLTNVVVVAFELVPALAMLWLARGAARAFPQRRVRRSPYRLAALAVLPLGVVMAAASLRANINGSPQPYQPGMAALAALVGAAVAAIVLGAGLAAARAGRGRVGAMLSAGAALIGADVMSAVAGLRLAGPFGLSLIGAPVWFPASLLEYGAVHLGRFFASGSHSVAGYVWSGPDLYGSSFVLDGERALIGLMYLTFAVGYAWRVARPAATGAPLPVTPVPVASLPPRSRSEAAQPVVGRPLAPRWARRIAVPLGLLGLGIWVYSTALTDYLVPYGDPTSVGGVVISTPAVANFGLVGLIVAVAALAFHLAGRGPVVAPVVLAFLAPYLAARLVTAHQWFNTTFMVVHDDWVGWAAAAGLIVVAVLAAVAAWSLNRFLAIRGADARAARRTLLTLAVTVAILVPNKVYGAADSTAGRTVAGYLTAALGWAMAVMLVAVCRTGRTSRLAMILLAVVPGAAAIYGVPESHLGHIYGPSPDLMIPLALGVIVIAAAGWYRPRRPVLTVTAWVVATLAAASFSMIIWTILPSPGALLDGSFAITSNDSGWYQSIALLGLGVAIGVLVGSRVVPAADRPIEPDPAPQRSPEPALA
jgi:hypothetical protein